MTETLYLRNNGIFCKCSPGDYSILIASLHRHILSLIKYSFVPSYILVDAFDWMAGAEKIYPTARKKTSKIKTCICVLIIIIIISFDGREIIALSHRVNCMYEWWHTSQQIVLTNEPPTSWHLFYYYIYVAVYFFFSSHATAVPIIHQRFASILTVLVSYIYPYNILYIIYILASPCASMRELYSFWIFFYFFIPITCSAYRNLLVLKILLMCDRLWCKAYLHFYALNWRRRSRSATFFRTTKNLKTLVFW